MVPVSWGLGIAVFFFFLFLSFFSLPVRGTGGYGRGYLRHVPHSLGNLKSKPSEEFSGGDGKLRPPVVCPPPPGLTSGATQ